MVLFNLNLVCSRACIPYVAGVLTLGGEGLDEVPHSVLTLDSLTSIDLSSNCIAAIPAVRRRLTST